MKNNLCVIFILMLLLFMFYTPCSVQASSPMFAVISFETGDVSLHRFNLRQDDVLRGLSQQLTDKMARSEEIRVVERSRVEDILTEQDFGLTGRVDSSSAAEIGRILGADYLVLGTLLQMDVRERGEISIGPLTLSGIEAEVKVNIRIVDSSTAEIITSFEKTAEAVETGVSLSDLEGISFDSSAFAESALGKSIEKAMEGLIGQLDEGYEDLFTGQEEVLEGEVLEILSPGRIIVNLGSEDGLKSGQTGVLLRMREVEGLDEPMSIPIGSVEVYHTDAGGAILEIFDLEDEPEVGDLVRFKRK